jgi:phosphohistidine phosphatase
MRPLNKRGRRDAPEMGRRLADRGIEVELMISSPAVRALTTAEALAEELGYPWDEIVTDERLYHADADEILGVIEAQDPWIDDLLIVGHNPGLTALANYLSRAGFENVPTSGVIRLTYDVGSWSDITTQKPQTVLFDYPKKEGRP